MKDTILVVDDKEVNRFMICEMFRKDYKLLEAEDGIEAIELLKKYIDSIAIVLLDIIMPNMDGFGVLDYMKNNSLLDDIPVVMITSDSSVETEKKVEKYDVAEVVRKPFIPAIIDRRVNNILALFQCDATTSTNLKEIGGTANAGNMAYNKNTLPTKKLILIHQSVTGLFETEEELV